MNIDFLPAGECQLELVDAVEPESDIERSPETKGEGPHQIGLEGEDVDGAIKKLLGAGVRMIDEVPSKGFSGTEDSCHSPEVLLWNAHRVHPRVAIEV